MDTLELDGDLADRGPRPLGDFCGIDRAMQLVGQRTTMLLLREAFYGERRFDGFAARTGMTEAAAAKRLKEKEKLKARGHVTGAHQFLKLNVEGITEFYEEEGDLAE